MANHIDTALFRAFLAVAESGGMTHAAQRLHLTQAAVSQRIKRLEDMFQVKLFERESRRVFLSPAGGRLLPLARNMLEVNDRIWGIMTTPDFEGEVRIGVPHDIVGAYMPPVLKSFSRLWPKVQVTIMASSTPVLVSALRKGELDLTLTTEEGTGPHGECLFAETLVWAGAKGGEACFADPLPISLGDKKCTFRSVAIQALADDGRDWRPVSDNGELVSIYAALQADLGVAPLLASTIPNDLTVVPAEARLPRLPDFNINLYLAPSKVTAVADELAAHIREQLPSPIARAA